jgi:hypothetical protein
MGQTKGPGAPHSESLARSEKWELIRRLADAALAREERHRASLAAGRADAEPSTDALLATLAASDVEARLVAKALAPALRGLFPPPPGSGGSTTRRGGLPVRLREGVLLLLAAEGPLHAREIASSLKTELSPTLSFLTDMVRDTGELEHPAPGMWGLSAQGWREARALAAEQGSAR